MHWLMWLSIVVLVLCLLSVLVGWWIWRQI